MRNTFQKVLKCLKPCVNQTTVKCAAAIVVLLTYIIYTVREDSHKDIHEELLKGFAALGVGFGAQAVVNDVIFLCKEFFTLVARGRRLQNNKINFRLINDVPPKAKEANVKVIKSERDMKIEKGTRLQPAEVYTSLIGMVASKENFSLRFIIKEKDSQRLELARVYERKEDKKLFVVYYPLNDTIKNINPNPLLSQTLPKVTQKLKENGIEIDDAAHLIPIAENNILKIGPFKFQIAHYVSAIMDQKQNQYDIIDSIKDRGYSLTSVIDNLREIFKPSKPRIEVTHTGKQSILNNWKCGNFVIETFNQKISASPVTAFNIGKEEIQKHFEFLMSGRKSILNPPDDKIIKTTQFNIPIDNREIISKEFILRQIDQRIKQLNRGWNPVKESPKAKIEALKMLKTSIKEANANETFTQALQDWKTGKPSKYGKVKKFEEDDTKKIIYPDAVISEHRNRFFTPTKKTETQEFIESLEKDYGNKKLV